MKEKIFEQLKKCKVPLPEYSIHDLELIIPRAVNELVQPSLSNEEFAISTEYLVRVNKSLVYPCDWYYTIHNNWNQGNGPTDEMLYIKILAKAGKMLRVAAVGYNNRQPWYGWLPQTNITILERR